MGKAHKLKYKKKVWIFLVSVLYLFDEVQVLAILSSIAGLGISISIQDLVFTSYLSPSSFCLGNCYDLFVLVLWFCSHLLRMGEKN